MIDKNIIRVAYALIDITIIDAYVSILSLLKNSKHNIELILLYDELLSKESLNKIKQLEKEFDNVAIKEIFVDKSEFKTFETNSFIATSGTIATSNLYRMILCTEKYDFDKFIYINTDSVIQDDLWELYNTDIKDYYFAACEETIMLPEHMLRLNKNYNEIFATGIMLVNCEKCRQDNIFDSLKEYISNNKNIHLDTTDLVYQSFFADKWKKLNITYNFIEPWYTKVYNEELINSSEYKKAKTYPAIINFRGPKPRYTGCYHSMKDVWWKYAHAASFNINELQTYKLSTTSAKNSFKYSWLLSRIFPYIKPYLGRIIIGFLIAIPLGLLDGVTAFALKPYMDYVVGGKSLDFTVLNHSFSIESIAMAFILPAAVIMFALLQGVLRYLNDYISAWTSQRITNDVKFDLFHRLIHMHPQFFDDNSSGIVISRYMGDPQTASAGIVDQIKSITTNLCGAMGLIAVMVYSSYKLAFIGVLVLCMAFVPVALIRKRIKETSNKNMVIGGNITTNINETYSGNKVMAAYALQDRQEKYFKQQVWKSFNINMSLTKRAAWMSPLMYLIASVGIAIVLGYGTYLINTGNMTAGSFASFVTSLLLLYKPVKGLGGTLTGIQNIFVAMGRVFELFDLEPAIKETKNPIEMKGLNSGITFENIVFEYIPNQPVLKNINLNVTKNETIAVVGNSGGGKSTLVNLIPRFYDIKSGHLKIDGIDVKDLSIKSLRKNISMVFQDNFLYSGTIKDNIMMGNPEATTEELMAAIKSAHLQDMIQELPEGLETELGERGLTLSGGQRQRVAIARAMLRNAPIVILDEATSALDNESEAIVQKAMDNLMQNRTVFIIAHRLSTIKNADRIAVINEGELVELGRHEDLINIENGQYKHLYEMQFKKQPSLT